MELINHSHILSHRRGAIFRFSFLFFLMIMTSSLTQLTHASPPTYQVCYICITHDRLSFMVSLVFYLLLQCFYLYSPFYIWIYMKYTPVFITEKSVLFSFLFCGLRFYSVMCGNWSLMITITILVRKLVLWDLLFN